MTNRDILNEAATMDTPDASEVMAKSRKPRRHIGRAAAIACAAVLVLGATGTVTAAAMGYLAIGPAAQSIASMSPEEWAQDEWDLPPFNVEAEIEAIEEFIPGLEVIIDYESLQPGEAYNVLGITTVGTDVTYAFCKYDPTLYDKLWDPDIATSVHNLKCVGSPEVADGLPVMRDGKPVMRECNSDKFCFVSLGSRHFVDGGKSYRFDIATFRCAECGIETSYRISEMDESEYEVPENTVEIELIEGENGTYTIKLVPQPEVDTPNSEGQNEVTVPGQELTMTATAIPDGQGYNITAAMVTASPDEHIAIVTTTAEPSNEG